MTRMRIRSSGRCVAVITALVAAGCGKKPPPVARPMPPPPATGARSATRRRRRRRRRRSTRRRSLPAPPPVDDHRQQATSTTLNRDSPLAPVFFALDSFEISDEGRSTCCRPTPQVLKKQPTWQVTVEGHCDERGTAEYNLGARRAPRGGGQDLSGVARHRRRAAAHGELRQGVPVRSRPRRSGVDQEPPRAFRDHRKVAPTARERILYADEEVHDDVEVTGALALTAVLLAAVPAAGAATGTAADGGRHCACCRSRRSCCRTRWSTAHRGAQGGQRPHRRAGRRRTARRFADSEAPGRRDGQRHPRRPRAGRRHQRADHVAVAGSRGAARGRLGDAGHDGADRPTGRRPARPAIRRIRRCDAAGGTTPAPGRRPPLRPPRTPPAARPPVRRPASTTWPGPTTPPAATTWRSRASPATCARSRKSESADNAQFYIGESYYQRGRWPEAVDAFDRVISNYPTQRRRRPGATTSAALSYERLNQPDRVARSTTSTLMKTARRQRRQADWPSSGSTRSIARGRSSPRWPRRERRRRRASLRGRSTSWAA